MSNTISHDTRRGADLSDFDFYRTSATALRRQAIRDGKTLRTIRAGLLTAAGVLGLVFLLATAPAPASRGLSSMAQTEAPQVW